MKKLIVILIVIVGCTTKQQINYGTTLSPVDSVALKSLDISKGVPPEIWGAKADGVTDCTWALNECAKWCTTQYQYNLIKIILRTGVYRTTDEWIIGGKCINADRCFNNILVDSTWNIPNYNTQMRATKISIEGTGSTALYADFTDTAKLKATIFYGVQGDTRAGKSTELYAAQISGIGIYAKGYFNGLIPTRNIQSYNGNKTAGIVCLYNTMLNIDKVTLYGLKEGLILNNSYFSNTSNVNFIKCDRGYYTYQSHSSIVTNCIGWFCNKAFEIRSGAMVFNNIGTISCGVSMHMGTGSNTVNAAYFESSSTAESQVIIGYEPTDPFYVGWDLTDGIVFNTLIVVANKPTGQGTGTGILMKNTARRIFINGGSVQSCYITATNPVSKITITGVLGTFPSSITKVL